MGNKLKEWLIEDMYADIHRWMVICTIMFLCGFFGTIKSNWYFGLFPLSIVIFLIKSLFTGRREP